MYPLEVQQAIDTLADYGSALARERHPEYEHHDKLRDWIAGSIEVQFTEPDYEQIEENP